MDAGKAAEERTPQATGERARRFRSGLVAAGASAGLTLAGLGVAAAQTDAPTTQPDPGPTSAPAPGTGGPGPGGRFHGGIGPHHKGLRFGLHGEFTTRAPGGGYQTLAAQTGEVTAVTASSITVKSEDGFSRTYGVDDNTMVNAGDEGIADVAAGDQVHVTALVVDGKAGAVAIHDLTQDAERRERWAPGPRKSHPAPGGEPGTGSTTTTTTG